MVAAVNRFQSTFRTFQTQSMLLATRENNRCLRYPNPKKSIGDASGAFTGISSLGIIVIPVRVLRSSAYAVVKVKCEVDDVAKSWCTKILCNIWVQSLQKPKVEIFLPDEKWSAV